MLCERSRVTGNGGPYQKVIPEGRPPTPPPPPLIYWGDLSVTGNGTSNSSLSAMRGVQNLEGGMLLKGGWQKMAIFARGAGCSLPCAEIDPPPAKDDPGVLSPLAKIAIFGHPPSKFCTPLIAFQQHPWAGCKSVRIASLFFAFFFRYFSQLDQTNFSRFRRTLSTGFDCWLCYFRRSRRMRLTPSGLFLTLKPCRKQKTTKLTNPITSRIPIKVSNDMAQSSPRWHPHPGLPQKV